MAEESARLLASEPMTSPFSSNPFESPAVVEDAPPPAPQVGVLRPVVAFEEAVRTLRVAPVPALGVVVAALLVHTIGAFVWLGWLVVTPVLAWGLVRFALDAQRGDARFDAVWAGFSRFGEAWGGMFVVLLVGGSACAPGAVLLVGGLVAGAAASLTGHASDVDHLMWLGLSGALFGAWAVALLPRVALAPFLVVDRGLNGWDALRTSWRATRGQTLRSAALTALSLVALALGALLLTVGLIPSLALVVLAHATAYRQLFGDDPEHPIG
jgi:hypothetical protein